VFDSKTGLYWGVPDVADQAEPRDFEEAAAYCAAHGKRLPSIMELRTLVDFGTSDPCIREDVGFISSPFFWSSEPSESNLEMVNVLTTDDGKITERDKTDKEISVCVEGQKAKPSEDVLAWNIDTFGGLMWATIDEEAGWNEAIDNCSSLTLYGFTDWRLANISEMTLLGFRELADPGLFYWSSTTYMIRVEQAWGYRNKAWVTTTKSEEHKSYCTRVIP